MRAVVLVEWGPQRWQKALIAPGETLVVGRLERAGLVIPHDEAMSGLHLEIAWDGARCTFRDLASASGTELDGERALSGEIEHGSFLQAGETVLSVYVEDRVPAWSPPPGEEGAPAARRIEALAALRAEPAPLYAVLDAARADRIQALLRSSAAPARSLYEGLEGESLDDVAPYLASVPRDGRLLERLADEGWGRGWGSFLTSQRPFKEIVRHLRRLLIAEVKGTEELFYFRFYDPRVLASTLSVATPRQKQLLFGEVVEAFVIEGPSGEPRRLVNAS